jgi:hypothetical protein
VLRAGFIARLSENQLKSCFCERCGARRESIIIKASGPEIEFQSLCMDCENWIESRNSAAGLAALIFGFLLDYT